MHNWEQAGDLGSSCVVQTRCQEITAWLHDNSSRVTTWVALDDLPLSAEDEVFRGRHVHTDAKEGLTREGVEQAIAVLSAPVKPG